MKGVIHDLEPETYDEGYQTGFGGADGNFDLLSRTPLDYNMPQAVSVAIQPVCCFVLRARVCSNYSVCCLRSF